MDNKPLWKAAPKVGPSGPGAGILESKPPFHAELGLADVIEGAFGRLEHEEHLAPTLTSWIRCLEHTAAVHEEGKSAEDRPTRRGAEANDQHRLLATRVRARRQKTCAGLRPLFLAQGS